MNKLIIGGVQKVVVCGICCLEGHATDAFPTLQGGDAIAKECMTHTLACIIKDGEITLTLGMDLGIILWVLSDNHVNHLLRIEQIFF